jgi:hypothetical protein
LLLAARGLPQKQAAMIPYFDSPSKGRDDDTKHPHKVSLFAALAETVTVVNKTRRKKGNR